MLLVVFQCIQKIRWPSENLESSTVSMQMRIITLRHEDDDNPGKRRRVLLGGFIVLEQFFSNFFKDRKEICILFLFGFIFFTFFCATSIIYLIFFIIIYWKFITHFLEQYMYSLDFFFYTTILIFTYRQQRNTLSHTQTYTRTVCCNFLQFFSQNF